MNHMTVDSPDAPWNQSDTEDIYCEECEAADADDPCDDEGFTPVLMESWDQYSVKCPQCGHIVSWEPDWDEGRDD